MVSHCTFKCVCGCVWVCVKGVLLVAEPGVGASMGITVRVGQFFCMGVCSIWRQLCVHVCVGTFMGVRVHHRAPGPPGPLPFLTAPWPLWWWWWWWPWASCLWGLGVDAPPLAWGEELLLGLKAGLVPDRPREGCRGLDAARPAGRKGRTGARLLSAGSSCVSKFNTSLKVSECLPVVLILYVLFHG